MLKTILLLAANPKGTVSLRLQEEEREIKERLRLAGYGKVPIYSTGATRPRDIQQAMIDFKPQIVHFTGHGGGQEGLAFEDMSGQLNPVGSEALANLFKLFSNRVECVVLNACYSKVQAEAISLHIKYVIGMNQAIGDHAAIEFSIGFYMALSAGESIEFAYELGCNAIQLAGIQEHLTPVLLKKVESEASSQASTQIEHHKLIVQEPINTNLEQKPKNIQGSQNSNNLSGLAALSVFRDLDFSPEMIVMTPGSFLMGASDKDLDAYDDEKPQHQVKILHSFAMSRYLVTFDEFDEFCRITSRQTPSDEGWGRKRKPVINVSWHDAVAYTIWLSEQTNHIYRLATEAEWEYACRAGTTSRYYCGEMIGEKHANIGTRQKCTTDVGSYPANSWGLYDMYGNVWEWVQDVWHSSYLDSPQDGSAWLQGGEQLLRVVRGGSINYGPRDCSSSVRCYLASDTPDKLHGFRVVRSL